VQRLKANAPLVKANSSTFYVPGPEGYIDYPAMWGGGWRASKSL